MSAPSPSTTSTCCSTSIRGSGSSRCRQVRRPGPRRLLLRARHAVRRRPRAAGVRRHPTPRPGRSAGGHRPDALRRRGRPGWRAAAGRPGLRDEPAPAAAAGRRRHRRLPRLVLPAAGGPGRRRACVGAEPVARRAVGADAHPRRAAGPAAGPGVRPPLHEHVPGQPLPAHADADQARRRRPRLPHPPHRHGAAGGPADRAPRDRGRRAARPLHELAVPLTDEEEARLLDRVEQLRAEDS